jgi:hypothetical protein
MTEIKGGFNRLYERNRLANAVADPALRFFVYRKRMLLEPDGHRIFENRAGAVFGGC